MCQKSTAILFPPAQCECVGGNIFLLFLVKWRKSLYLFGNDLSRFGDLYEGQKKRKKNLDLYMHALHSFTVRFIFMCSVSLRYTIKNKIFSLSKKQLC